MLLYSIWFYLSLLSLHLLYANSVSSVPLIAYQDNQLQTYVVKLQKINPTNYQSTTITFRKAKITPLTIDNILLGIAQMDFNISLYEMYFVIAGKNLTQSKLNIGLTDYNSSLVQIKTSVLIISNEYKYQNYIKILTGFYNSYNYYIFNFTLPFDYTSFNVYHFFCGGHLKNSSKIFWFEFSYSIYLTTPNATLETSVNIRGGLFYDASIKLKLLIVYPLYFPVPSKLQVYSNIFYYQSTTPSYNLGIGGYKPNSEIFFGLNQFRYITGSGNVKGFYFTLTYTPTLLSFTLDDQFSIFLYNVLIINNLACYDFTHSIFNYNGSLLKYQCFDQCPLVNQFVAYDAILLDYKCIMCQPLCNTCTDSNGCTTCIIGYSLTETQTCVLNSSYYLSLPASSYAATICSSNSNLVACDICYIEGSYCLKCLPNSYMSFTSSISLSSITVLGTITYNGPYYQCIYCSSVDLNCIKCNITTCFKCQNPYKLKDFKTCYIPPTPPTIVVILPCNNVRCQDCLQSALDNCLKCYDTALAIIDGKCVSTCGDGIVLDAQTCDDGNNFQHDGCSSDCTTQQEGWNCQVLPGSRKSQCQYTQPIILQKLSIKKTIYDNKVTILMKNANPFIRSWMNITNQELKQMVSFKVPKLQTSQNAYVFEYTVKFISESMISSSNLRLLQTTVDTFYPQQYHFIEIEITYAQTQPKSLSLNHQPSIVTFSPGVSNRFTFQSISASSVEFNLVTDDNQAIQYFSPSYYSLYSLVKSMSLLASILIYVILLISILACILDGNNSQQILLTIETAGLVQFSYFSLIGIGQLNPLFIAMAQGLKYSCGFDILFLNDKTKQRILLGIGIESISIMNNVNMSILIVVLLMISSLILLIIKKIKKNNSASSTQIIFKDNEEEQQKQQTQGQKSKQNENKINFQKWSKILMINFGFGLFIFFMYKYVISFMIQIKFGTKSFQGIQFVIIGFVSILLLSFVVLLFVKFDLFVFLTQKLNNFMTFKEKQEIIEQNIDSQAIKIKKQKIYLLFLIMQRLVNSITLILLFQMFSFHGLIPIFIFCFQIIYITFYDKNIYNPPNKFRMYFNCFIGILIQILLITRKIMISQLVIGGQETGFGLYLPFTILSLLYLVLLVGLAFQIYSVKRTRCCDLEIDWQKIDQSLKDQIKAKQLLKAKMEVNNEKAQQISKIKNEFQKLRSDSPDNSRNETCKKISVKEEIKQNAQDYITKKINNLNDFKTEIRKISYNETRKDSLYESQQDEQDVQQASRDMNIGFTKDMGISKDMIKHEIRQKLNELRIPGVKKSVIDKERQLSKNKCNGLYKYTDSKRYDFYEQYNEI